MEIRLLNQAEAQKARQLWDLCFDDNPAAFSDWFFLNKFSPQTTLGAFEGGRLMGSVQMLPYCFMLRQTVMPGASIAGVCTHPDARGRGVARRLMAKADAQMRLSGQVLATLYPTVSYDFYRRLGWGVATRRLRMSYTAADLAWPAPGGLQTRAVTADDIPLMDRVYRRAVRPLNLAADRTAGQWRSRMQEILSDGGQGILVLQNAQPGGYAWFHLEQGKLETDELVYENPASARALAWALAQLAPRAVALLGADSPLPALLKDGRGQVELEPFLMARAVDVRAMLARLPWREGAVPFSLCVEDPQAPWQHGAWQFSPTCDGRIGMLPRPMEDALPRIQAGALMQWVCGAQSAADACGLGAFAGGCGVAQSMDRLLPTQKTGGFEMY